MSLAVADCPVFLAIACPEADGVTGLKPRLPAGRGLSQAEALITAAAEAVELRASLAGSHLSDLRRAPRREGVAQVAADRSGAGGLSGWCGAAVRILATGCGFDRLRRWPDHGGGGLCRPVRMRRA